MEGISEIFILTYFEGFILIAILMGLYYYKSWVDWHFKNKKSSTLLDEIRDNYRTKKIN